MVGVLMAGTHELGPAPWDMRMYALSGIVADTRGNTISSISNLSIDFKKGEDLILIVDPKKQDLNFREPVIFCARRARR
jgi:sporulation protein YlmC with PRC-barrel domain